MEEILERRLEIPKRLLQHDIRDCLQSGRFGLLLQVRQQSGRLVVTDPLAVLVKAVCPDSKEMVVHEPSASERLRQDDFLIRSRIDAVAVGPRHGIHDALI